MTTREQIVKRVNQMKTVQDEARALFEQKNTDYGDSFAEFGTLGVIIRMSDKIKRCISITNNSIQVKDETLRDTLIDLHNYSAMAIMLMDEKNANNDTMET